MLRLPGSLPLCLIKLRRKKPRRNSSSEGLLEKVTEKKSWLRSDVILSGRCSIAVEAIGKLIGRKANGSDGNRTWIYYGNWIPVWQYGASLVSSSCPPVASRGTAAKNLIGPKKHSHAIQKEMPVRWPKGCLQTKTRFIKESFYSRFLTRGLVQ